MDKNVNNENNFEEIMKVIKYLDKGDQIRNPFIKTRLEKAIRTGDTTSLYKYLQKHPHIIEKIKMRILIESKLKEENPFWPPPYKKEEAAILSGPLVLGTCYPSTNNFGINPERLNLNVIVVGQTRSGKSNLNLIALDRLLYKEALFNIIIIDLKKEYRCLLPKHPNLKILTFKNLRLNPLEVPEWADPKDHINNVAEVFCRENYILAFGKNMFIDNVSYLYKEKGVFDGSKNFPTFKDLYNLVKNTKAGQREAASKASLLSRLKPYVDYPEIFCCEGFPFNVWLNNNLSIELDNITNEMYATIANLIISSIYNYYHTMNLRGSKTRTLFVVDEAGVLFDARRDRINNFGDSYINTLVRRGGEFGLGFWVTSQEPNTISQSIHSNSFLKFLFPLSEGNQIRGMATSMGLNEDQRFFHSKLPEYGRCIVRYSPYPNSFQLAVPPFLEEKAVSDTFVEECMKDFYNEINPKQETMKIETMEELQIKQDIPKDALALLKHISNHPFGNYTTHRTTCSLKENKVDKARNWLKNNSYISVKDIKTTRGRSRPACYLVLEEKALNYLNIKQHFGKGSFKHQLYCYLLKKKLEQESWEAKVESTVYPSTKLIDVVAEKDKKTVGYEVTLHFDNLQRNIEEDFKVIDDLVIVVEKNDFGKALEEVQNCKSVLNSNKHIDIQLIEDFF